MVSAQYARGENARRGYAGGATHALWVDRWQVQLPEQFTEFRPHQVRAIREIVEYFEAGYRWVMLDAPTGAGKTVIGEAVRQILSRQSLYLCTTKTLQAQFVHDFPYAALIKGRSNYPTLDHPERFESERAGERLSCADCLRTAEWADDAPFCDECPPWSDESPGSRVIHCPHCHPSKECPYVVAKRIALNSPLTVANTAYLINEANFVGQFGWDKDIGYRFPFWVIDEADTLESLLMSFVELGIRPRTMKRLRLSPPEKVTVPESWIEWCEENAPKIRDVASSIVDPDRAKEADDLYSLAHRADMVRKFLVAEPDNWVLDGYKEGGMSLRPVTVSGHAHEFLWRHGHRFLLMSATLISDEQVAADLGIDEWATVRVDSQFPIERRPIVAQPRANMTSKTKEDEWPKMAAQVRQVIEAHRGERVLVHTVSYELAEYLHSALSDLWGVMTYRTGRERERVLEQFRVTEGAVLFAPSLDRGVDLPDDEVRVIVIAKIPFPYLGDKQVSKRFYGTGVLGRTWYATQTVRSLVQMTGRGMRHRDDWCVSYILDAQFTTNVWRNNRSLIPQWWAAALEWRL